MDFTLRVGFPIVVILAMIRGYLVPGFIYDRVVKENDRLQRLAEEKVIPLAVEGQQLMQKTVELLDRIETRELARARSSATSSAGSAEER